MGQHAQHAQHAMSARSPSAAAGAAGGGCPLVRGRRGNRRRAYSYPPCVCARESPTRSAALGVTMPGLPCDSHVMPSSPRALTHPVSCVLHPVQESYVAADIDVDVDVDVDGGRGASHRGSGDKKGVFTSCPDPAIAAKRASCTSSHDMTVLSAAAAAFVSPLPCSHHQPGCAVCTILARPAGPRGGCVASIDSISIRRTNHKASPTQLTCSLPISVGRNPASRADQRPKAPMHAIQQARLAGPAPKRIIPLFPAVALRCRRLHPGLACGRVRTTAQRVRLAGS